MNLTGVVLAGGKSTRLGHDKALVRLDERDNGPGMLARTVALLRDLCDNVLVVGQKHEGYTCFLDLAPGNGPVGGIATALELCQTPCLVLSCDLPFMDRGVLERLAATHARRPAKALCTSYLARETGRVEALVAIYEPGALPFFQNCVAAKLLKISLVVPRPLQHFLPYAAADALPFFNINYPEDLKTAQRIALGGASFSKNA